ncbi:unnamed protein product [Protopolystoma xenopodis]|uniref:G domain-containing protein n=1 Tax=Protopolystoma xenopodis TaxID=117903 RepID=A0A448XJ62_9PLAT|nr:unnamed protein product [Protopolystoma xenopodis]
MLQFGHRSSTLVLRPDLVLCDCPGLVMPSLVHSRAELIVAGILPIDEMRDYLSPIQLVSTDPIYFVFIQIYFLGLSANVIAYII